MSILCKNAPWYDCPECKNTQHEPRPVKNPYGYDLRFKWNNLDLNGKDRLKVGDPIDVFKYLFTSERDYLIRYTGLVNEPEKVYASDIKSKKYIAIFCFYLPVLTDSIVPKSCNAISQTFHELQLEGKSDFEVVLVARIKPDYPSLMLRRTPSAIFSEFLSWFPWLPLFLAVPLSDSDSSTERLFSCTSTFCHSDIGSLIADLEDQKVVHTDSCAGDFRLYGAYMYPFTPERRSDVEGLMRTMGRGAPLEIFLGCQTSQFLKRVSSLGIGETVSSLKEKVVWIFLLNDGQLLDKICDMYEKCKKSGHEFEVVLVNTKCSHKNWILSWKQYRRPVDKNKVCWEWLELPYSDKVNRRLRLFCNFPDRDTLLVVGPNATYVQRDAFRFYHRLGIEAYPFTKEDAWRTVADRVQGLRLLELLTDAGIEYLLDRYGVEVELSSLERTNVVLYFSDIPLGRHYPTWEDNVAKWFVEFISQVEPFEMIYVCTYQADDVSFSDKCSKLPWLAVPNDKRHSETLLKKLFGTVYCENTLVAFGSDGRLLTLFLQEKLSLGVPWSFADPQNAINLVIYECWRILRDQLNTITDAEDFAIMSDD